MLIKTKRVFDIKRNGEVRVERYKVRLVVKGSFQIPGIVLGNGFSASLQIFPSAFHVWLYFSDGRSFH